MKLTRIERNALKAGFNLANGHAFHSLSNSQIGVLDQALSKISSSMLGDILSIEAKFLRAFHLCCDQNYEALHGNRCFITRSATQSLEIASLLFPAGSKVALVEPCVDFVGDLLARRHTVTRYFSENEVAVISEDQLRHLDVLVVVSPNNPTGWTVTEESLRNLAGVANRSGTFLLFDHCFCAFQRPDDRIDIRATLESEACSFAIIEDTGKFLPLNDLKASILCVSEDLADPAKKAFDEKLLFVSPIILDTIAEVLTRHEFRWLSDCCCENRGALAKTIRPFGLMLRPQQTELGVSIIIGEQHELTNVDVASISKCAWDEGVALVPGSAFLTSQHGSNRFVRVSLARDNSFFEDAMTSLASALATWKSGR